MGEGRVEILWHHAEDAKTAPGEYQSAASTEDARWLGRITHTGSGM